MLSEHDVEDAFSASNSFHLGGNRKSEASFLGDVTVDRFVGEFFTHDGRRVQLEPISGELTASREPEWRIRVEGRECGYIMRHNNESTVTALDRAARWLEQKRKSDPRFLDKVLRASP